MLLKEFKESLILFGFNHLLVLVFLIVWSGSFFCFRSSFHFFFLFCSKFKRLQKFISLLADLSLKVHHINILLLIIPFQERLNHAFRIFFRVFLNHIQKLVWFWFNNDWDCSSWFLFLFIIAFWSLFFIIFFGDTHIFFYGALILKHGFHAIKFCIGFINLT